MAGLPSGYNLDHKGHFAGETSILQQQKFLTNGLKSVWNLVSSFHLLTE